MAVLCHSAGLVRPRRHRCKYVFYDHIMFVCIYAMQSIAVVTEEGCQHALRLLFCTEVWQLLSCIVQAANQLCWPFYLIISSLLPGKPEAKHRLCMASQSARADNGGLAVAAQGTRPNETYKGQAGIGHGHNDQLEGHCSLNIKAGSAVNPSCLSDALWTVTCTACELYRCIAACICISSAVGKIRQLASNTPLAFGVIVW